MILRAKFVVPISHPVIEDGAVVIHNDRIVAVGRKREILQRYHPAYRGGTRSTARVHLRDLGDVALLPGLINAHCHLDYTNMAGKLWPSRGFLHWLDQIVTLKRSWNLEDYLRSWRRGEGMLLAGGVTTVADVEAVAANLVLGQTSPLRLWSFLELIDIGREKDFSRILASALSAARPRRSLGGYGLCPHSLYTSSGALIRAAAAVSRKRGWPLTIHLAESREEWEMFRRGRGPLHERFRSLGRDMRDCGSSAARTMVTPTRALAQRGVFSKNLLVAHANYVTDDDIALLAQHRVSVVHCPRSHAFFSHRKFMIEKFLAHGVNVCLGTDSLASNDALDLFAEMQALGRAHPGLRPEIILAMATRNGARALQQRQNCGTLIPGKWADLVAVPIRNTRRAVFEEIIAARSPVPFTMIGGKEQK